MNKAFHSIILPFLALLVCSISAHSQDTLSVFFDSGKSKLEQQELSRLNSLRIQYDLTDLDSIYFIGMADSIGNFRSNLKLSEKRARNVSKQFEEDIPENTLVKIRAIGENDQSNVESNRRVDIIMFFHPVLSSIVDDIDCHVPEKFCFNIDYSFLNQCYKTSITKKKKEYVVLESESKKSPKQKELYFGWVDDKGTFTTQKVKWKNKKTGTLWWAKKRHVAIIPKENFDQFKLFKLTNFPCDTCSEYFVAKPIITKVDSCLEVDRFLMNNFQFRFKIFNPKKLKIRAPREYVNLDKAYFNDLNYPNQMIWEVKKGRRKEQYYYSIIPRSHHLIGNISRYTDCCRSSNVKSDTIKINCGAVLSNRQSKSLSAELGSYYDDSKFIPYLGITAVNEGKLSRFNLLLGTNSELNILGSLSYQFHFLNEPVKSISTWSKWQKPNVQTVAKSYARLYLGSEIIGLVKFSFRSSLESNIHLGWALVNSSKTDLIKRTFVHFGFGVDFSEMNDSPLFPIAKIGVNLRLKNF